MEYALGSHGRNTGLDYVMQMQISMAVFAMGAELVQIVKNFKNHKPLFLDYSLNYKRDDGTLNKIAV